MSVPVIPDFVPTTAEVLAIYMRGKFSGNYASVPEKIETELGFYEWLDSLVKSGGES